MNNAIQMAGDLAERERARLIVLEMLEHMRTQPVEGRADAGNSWLHVRLLNEMCDYKDRMTKQIADIIRETLPAVKSKEGG